MQDYANLLRDFIDVNGLSQAALAKKAGVSQATVSRALFNKHERHGGARQKLFAYIQAKPFSSAQAPQGDAKSKVMAAFSQVWDNSDAHAEAIARVIRSLSGLEPKERQKRR